MRTASPETFSLDGVSVPFEKDSGVASTRIAVDYMKLASVGLNLEIYWELTHPSVKLNGKYTISRMTMQFIDRDELYRGFFKYITDRWELQVEHAVNEVIDGRSEDATWVNNVIFVFKELKPGY